MPHEKHAESLEREQQGQHKRHHQTDEQLKGQAYLDIVHELVLPCLHHQRIGWRGKWRGETHAGAQRHGKKECVRAYSYL